MEKFYLTLMLLFVSFITLFFFIIFHRHKTPFTISNLPPGRMGHPVIGESLEFISCGRKGHPTTFIFERITKYSSQIFKTSLFLQPTIMCCGSESHKFLFSNENKLVKSWWPETINKIFPTTLQSNSNEETMRMKRLLPQFLSPKALQGHIGVMDTITQTHFATYWENKTHITVSPLAKRYTFWLACRLFMSVEDPNEVERLLKPFDTVVKGILSMPINFPGTPYNQAIKASKFIRNEFLKIIKQRKLDLADGKATPTQDIVSNMLFAQDEDGQYMSEHSIADKIIGLLIGAYETTSSTCTFIVKFLAEFPQIYQKVYQEQMEIVKSKPPGEQLNRNDIEKMKYSWNVACEVIRLVPPVPGAFKEATTDFVFNGFSIPKGWKLYWSVYSTHMNSKYFQDPEKFDPHRFDGSGPAPYTYVPFGGGPRLCPGKDYARMEILVFIHNLVKRFKWENLIPNEKIVVCPHPFPANGLPIRLYPH